MKTKLTLSILLLTLLFSFEKGIAQAPAWVWAKSAGGVSNDDGRAISTDGNGNLLVIGYFHSPTITFGSITLTNADASGLTSDIFVVKYDASGNVLWAKSAGGIADDFGNGIFTDSSGKVLVTGYFISPTITIGSITLTNVDTTGSSSDIFIVKFDGSGNVLWAKSEGGTYGEAGFNISSDASGNVLVTGYFISDSITFGTTTLINTGGTDLFVVKYDASGNVLWAKSAEGSGYDYGVRISTDGSSNVFVIGSFQSDSVTFGTTTLANAGSSDIFIAKYDTSGNNLWVKSAGGISLDECYGISTDVSGNVLVTGYFKSDPITFSTTTLTNAGSKDIFIAKYDISGNILWVKSAGGISDDIGSSISTDATGNILLTGSFESDSISFGTTTLINSGDFDIFLVKYDASGNVLWAKSAGGTSSDYGSSIACDASGNVMITGSFKSNSVTFGTTTLTNAGTNYSDIFVAKLDGTTGIADASNPLNATSIYPNPATDYITINTNSNKKQEITITDITGQLIYTTTTLSDKTTINTKDFPQGVYAVQVQAGDAVQTSKVIVVR